MKETKEAVDYSKGMKKTNCGVCESFRPFYDRLPSEGTCVKVLGVIESGMWCKRFTPEN